MSAESAIRQSGSTFSAYRYHCGELIWARLSLSSGDVFFGDSVGYVNGTAVYPSPEKYWNKFDWQPWRKGEGREAILFARDHGGSGEL